MEHKGIEFKVVQTASPTRWKWTIQLDAERARSGVSYSMQSAILGAKHKIDNELKRVRPKQE